MDSYEDQATTTPDLPSTKELDIYNCYPKDKRKGPVGIKIKFTQIQKPPEPAPSPQLVLYDSPGRSRSQRKKKVAVKNIPDGAESMTSAMVLDDSPGESRSYRKKRITVNNLADSAETKTSAMVQAEEVRANLGAEFPSFAKALVRSNVTVGFWMHLPMRFCKMHLPKNDTTVLLEVENGGEYIINYIADRTALSGGWKHFCGTQQLAEGDVLIFQLVKPLRFKVFIVRGNGLARVDGNLDIPNSVAHETKIKSVVKDQAEKSIKIQKKAKHLELTDGLTDENNPESSLMLSDTNREITAEDQAEKGIKICDMAKQLDILPNGLTGENKPENSLMLSDTNREITDEDQAEKSIKICDKARHLELLPNGLTGDDKPENGLMLLDTNQEIAGFQSAEDGEHCCLEPLGIVKSSEPIAGFKDANSIETFSIVVNGLAIDSELSDHHRTKYYELCCSQNSYLHNNLLQSINYKLAAEIIIGTVNISEAIGTSKLLSSREDYAVWDKTLKGFELLGMNVGFLRARLERLIKLATESEEFMESERRAVRLEQARVSEEIKSLQVKLLQMKEAREKLGDEIDSLKMNAEQHEIMFQEVVNSPWKARRECFNN